jgi:DNA-directed RNA polymerase
MRNDSARRSMPEGQPRSDPATTDPATTDPATADPAADFNNFLLPFRSPESRARQAGLETSRRTEAIRLLREETERRQSEGFAADLPQAQSLIRTRVGKLAAAIRWSLETKKAIGSYGEVSGTARKGGRPCSYWELLSQVDPEVAALLVLREMLKRVFTPGSNQVDLARDLAVSLENEAMVQAFKRNQPDIFADAVKRIRKRADGDACAMEELTAKMHTACAEQWRRWPARTARLMALDLIYMASADSEFLVRDRNNDVDDGGVKRKIRFKLSESGRRWWAEEGHRLENAIRDKQPMVCVPIPWSGPWGGGYVSIDTPPVPLVRNKGRKYLRRLGDLDLSTVYTAVNAIQNTPWAIDREVLAVARELWRGAVIPFAHRRVLFPLGPRPPEGSREWKLWWARRYREVERERRRASQRERIRRVLDLADTYRDEPAIFFPHNLDFRGRIYPCSSLLHPQGGDLERGLLRFALGKALARPEDADWLAVHGANRYGRSRLPFPGRIQWVRDHESEILAAAAEPLRPETFAFWSEAEHPFQFLAFCFEWRRYRASGDGSFVSRLPVAMDGTCNGLQHLYAMTFDERGGRLVNLVHTEEPADIYATVADRTKELLDRIARHPEETLRRRRRAVIWLKYGIDRAMTKPIVMVVPYGGTKSGCTRSIKRVLKKLEEEEGRPYPCSGDRESVKMLASVVWKALDLVIGSARDTMGCLQDKAVALAKQGKPISWTSPAGLWICQDCRKIRVERILYGPRQESLRLQGVFRSRTDEYDPRRQSNGISPNFTHSRDAAHLMRCEGPGPRSEPVRDDP